MSIAQQLKESVDRGSSGEELVEGVKPFRQVKINTVNVGPLWKTLGDVNRAWRRDDNAEGAARALYQLDLHLEDLKRELDKISEKSKEERKKFKYTGPL